MSEKTLKRLWPFFILVATGCYLTVEFSFNARLLDLVAHQFQPSAVAPIQHWGRLLSGFAAALLLWGWIPHLLRPGRHPVIVLVLMLGVSAAVVFGVYHGEKRLVDGKADSSGGEARRLAVWATFLRGELLDSNIYLVGIDLNGGNRSRPEDKAFLALMPMLVSSVTDIPQRFKDQARELIKLKIIKKSPDLQSPARFYDKTFRVSVKTIVNDYGSYVKGIDKLNKAFQSIPHKQDKAWREYTRLLAVLNLRPGSISAWYFPMIRSKARAKGMPVPRDWNPNDRNGFYRAIAEQIRNAAIEHYRAAVHKTGIRNLPWNLSNQQQFMSYPAVQRVWREQLHIKAPVFLSPNLDEKTFANIAYYPLLEGEANARLSVFDAPPAEFADGGRYAAQGRQAMEAVLVPAYALFFSLLGALVHIWKFLRYLLKTTAQIVTGHDGDDCFRDKAVRWLWTSGCAAAVVGALAFAVWRAPNAVTRSDLYRTLKARATVEQGPWKAGALTWIIQAEHFAYPVNEWLRRHALDGYDFGYHYKPDKETPTSLGRELTAGASGGVQARAAEVAAALRAVGLNSVQVGIFEGKRIILSGDVGTAEDERLTEQIAQRFGVAREDDLVRERTEDRR